MHADTQLIKLTCWLRRCAALCSVSDGRGDTCAHSRLHTCKVNQETLLFVLTLHQYRECVCVCTYIAGTHLPFGDIKASPHPPTCHTRRTEPSHFLSNLYSRALSVGEQYLPLLAFKICQSQHKPSQKDKHFKYTIFTLNDNQHEQREKKIWCHKVFFYVIHFWAFEQ